MRVIHSSDPGGERVVALGMFDGVHRGHQKLIRSAKTLAEEMGVPLRVCTFDRHPLDVLRPDDPPEMLSTIPEKAVQMYRLGVDEMKLIHFNRGTAGMEPEAFLEKLRNNITPRAVVAGWNYSYGRGGRGNADMLIADGRKYGYRVLIVPPETVDDGNAISSSLIRQKLKDGKIAEANDMLGYEYTLHGTVVQGKHQGSKLGFPTANIEPWKRKALPKYGVYTCLAETGTVTMPAIVNIGIQPTIPSGKVTIEAHILENCPALYGRKVRLTLLKMLRDERHFSSPEELKAQMENDRERAMKLFNMA